MTCRAAVAHEVAGEALPERLAREARLRGMVHTPDCRCSGVVNDAACEIGAARLGIEAAIRSALDAAAQVAREGVPLGYGCRTEAEARQVAQVGLALRAHIVAAIEALK